MIVGGEFVAERNPGRRVYRIGKIKDQRPDQEIPEVIRIALAERQLPEQREDQASGNRASKNIRSPPAVSGPGVVGYVSHQRVGDGVRQPGQGAEQSDQCRTESETEIEDDDHAADSGGQRVVDECAETVDEFEMKRNTVRGRGLIVRGCAHCYCCLIPPDYAS